MSKLGMKELFLGAALALPGASAEAKPNAKAEIVLRSYCAQVGEAARKEMGQFLSTLEVRTGGMSFMPGDAAKSAERKCLEEMEVVEPKASEIKK